jgi:hypothetical protein
MSFVKYPYRLCPHDADTLPSNQRYQQAFGSCKRPGVTLYECDLAYKNYGAAFTQCAALGRTIKCIKCLDTANMAGVCMACVVKNEKPDCTSCLWMSEGQPEVYELNESCQACWVDKAVPKAAKDRSYCDTCSNMYVPYYQEQIVDETFCNACIRNPATTDFSKCVIKRSRG